MIVSEEWADIIGPNGEVIGRRLVVTRSGEDAVPTTPRMTHFGFLSRLTPQERTAVR